MFHSDMGLAALIKYLEELPKETVLSFGIGNPHSYRGYYEDLCVEIDDSRTENPESWLKVLRSVHGEVLQGYKGGDFVMEDYSDVYLGEYGSSGGTVISRMLMNFIAGKKWNE